MKFVGYNKGVEGAMFGTGVLDTLGDKTLFMCYVREGRSKHSDGMIWMMGENHILGYGTGFTLRNGTCNNFGDSGSGEISVGACTIGDGSDVHGF